MVKHIVVLLMAYVVATGALMYANTEWFLLGDVAFGYGGWQLYWPLWSAFYAPPVVAALVVACSSRLLIRSKVLLLWTAVFVILA